MKFNTVFLLNKYIYFIYIYGAFFLLMIKVSLATILGCLEMNQAFTANYVSKQAQDLIKA